MIRNLNRLSCGIITDMGIIQHKERHDSLVDAEIAPKVEITALDSKRIETKELPPDVEAEVSGRELIIAGVVIALLAGLALWLMLGR